MSRYRQSFNEALQQVEKWSKDVEVKATGEHAGKTIDQLKREVDALRGKSNNEKEMGGLLFAIRAKQGWKKGEGSTGVEEATQTKHERGEVKVDKAERGERKAGESEDDYEDRESGGKGGLRPNPFAKKKKQDDLDRDNEAQATRSKFSPTAEDNVTGIPVSKKMAGTTVPPKQAPASQRMDKSKNLMPAPGWKTRKAGNKAGQMTTASYDPENKFRPAAEEHNCDEVHPEVSHKDWISQKESNLPPHLSKFLDKKGNPNPEAAKRMADGKKKRAVATKVKDVTPKGYGPNEEVELEAHPDAGVSLAVRRARKKKSAAQMKKDMQHADNLIKLGAGRRKEQELRGEENVGNDAKKHEEVELAIMSLDHKKAPRKLKITQKGLDALRADRDRPKVKTQVKITKTGRAAVEEIEIEEASKLPKGHYFKAGYELPNKTTVRFTSKGRGMSAPTTLWVKGPKDKDYKESKTYKNMAAAKKEYQKMKKEEVEIDELSNTTLGSYKAKAAAQASAADKKGNFKKADKRFSGITKATNKQFANDAKKEDMSLAPKGKGRKAAQAMYGVKEDLEFKVTIKGIPPFYVPAKTAAAVKQSLRRQLKHPDDIESIIRVTKAAQKIDYRKRAQGKSDEDDNKK